MMMQPAASDQQQWMMMQQPMPQVMSLQDQQAQGPTHYPQTYEEVRTLWVGDLQYWMDEAYLRGCFTITGEQVISAKVIRNKQTMMSECYGFVEFPNHATAERVLQTYNGTLMPQTEQAFRLNWASFGMSERRVDGSGSDHSIFVGDLAPDVTDYILQETFRSRYLSVKGAKVVIDPNTGRSKGYGFVRFGDENERTRAMTEMNGVYCSSRPMRINTATPKKALLQQYNKVTSTVSAYQSPQSYGAQPTQTFTNDIDPNNSTIFVGGLDPNVTDEDLRHVFGQFGDLVYVKIPLGKGCGFVQFTHRSCAEEALQKLHGAFIGQQAVRLSWGRSPANKQWQPSGWGQGQADPNQWNTGYYGYGQGYEGYGYTAQPQDASMYAYSNYAGYGNYPQQQIEVQSGAVNIAQVPEYREEEIFDPLAPLDVDKLNAAYIALHERPAVGHHLWLRTSEEVQS